jgi:hypothetical protein
MVRLQDPRSSRSSISFGTQEGRFKRRQENRSRLNQQLRHDCVRDRLTNIAPLQFGEKLFILSVRARRRFVRNADRRVVESTSDVV